MRIAIVCHSYPPDLGGIAQYAQGLARALAGRGRHVTVIAPPEVHLPPRQEQEGLVISRPAWMQRPQGGALGAIEHVRRQRRGIVADPDIAAAEKIVFGGLWWWPALALAARGRTYSLVMHGGETQTFLHRRRWRPWLDLAYRRAVRSAECVLCNSRFTAGLVGQASGRPDGLCVTYCGLDAAALGPMPGPAEARRKLALDDGPVVLSLGRLVPHKGFDVALQAMDLLAGDLPGLTYAIVGAGRDEPRLRAIAADLPSPARVRFEGAVDAATKSLWYAACDLLLMPSRPQAGHVEGFGIVFLEAAAHGRPSVGGRCGGVADAILDGQTGLLVDPLNIQAVASATGRLLRDEPLRRRLGQAARSRVLTDLTWDAVADRVEAAWSR